MALRYYKLEPEVPGGLGNNTVADTSVHPPKVTTLHLEMFGWLGDDLLETFPCFIVTKSLGDALQRSQLSGYSLAPLVVTRSVEFDEFYRGQPLPELFWLQPHGRVGEDDICTLPDATLLASEAALSLFRSHNLENCVIAQVDAT
jgi:hypothetical protein